MMKNTLLPICLLPLFLAVSVSAQEVEMTNLSNLNTEHLEFAPIPWGDGIIFTSSKSNRFLKCPSNNPGEYTDIFFAKRNEDGSFGERKTLKGKVNGKYNDGVATFNTLGNKMIFTRNNLMGKNEYDVIDLKLYSADQQGEQWVNAEELPFNSDEWSTCHPTLSPDGSLLVFASNRPGSTGGSMDLWASPFSDGHWSEPFNLGPLINTDSTEIFPFFDENGNLFFSSNGHGGFGGLDLFAATRDDMGKWVLAGNIGEPFNTRADDVSFVPLNNGTEGYLATAGGRNGQGLDDLYYWKRVPKPIEVIVVAVDEITGQRLPNASIKVVPGETDDLLLALYSKNAEPMELMTNSDGAVDFQVQRGYRYQILAEKEGYESATRNPTAVELSEKPEYIIPLKRKVYLAQLNGTVVDKNTNQPLALSNVKLVDKTTGQVIDLIADGNGKFSREINCDHSYEVMASKEGYDPSAMIPIAFDANACKENGAVSLTIPLTRKLIVYFRPIFFDFDKYNIRKPDATATLDSLVEIMQQYPSLKINLIGNCDARGTFTYNDRLGENRATSTRKYLVNKGIAADRITTNSLGERKPINKCADDIFCTETEHQANRRVDIIEIEHREQGVEFRTMEVRIVDEQAPDN